MLRISAAQMDAIEASGWDGWVARHVEALSEFLPDVAAAYSPAAFTRLVDTLLRRADLHEMVFQSETIPYCYASLTLGVGFEANRPWAVKAMTLRGEERGNALWDGLEATAAAGAGQ